MSISPRSSSVRRDWGTDDSETPILHVDMDSFFASVELKEDPELRGKPVVVGGLGNRGVVTSATYEARARGVRAGQPIGQARQLVPGAVFLPGRHHLYSEYSARVMDLLGKVTPDLEPLSIDEAFLDVSGSVRRLGSPLSIGEQIRRDIRERIGLPASVGIASTKSVAKIASAHAKPDGLLLIPSDRTVEFLHSLPVGALWGVGRKTGQILIGRGIDTVGDLANTELSLLSR
ncbi:MAG: DNA polymerase IV, partial [Scrofimicrobium sp.]